MIEIFDSCAVERVIGYQFKDKLLLRQCLTHSTYTYQHKNSAHNEELEFYGDAILSFIVTRYLFEHYASDRKIQEGDLSQMRSQLVCNSSLLTAVKKLKLDQYMLIGSSLKNAPHQDQKMFASVYEAVVAGIYIDGGEKSAEEFINRTLIKVIKINENSTENKKKINGDAKSTLQEIVQKHKLGSLSYEVLSKTGQDHQPEYCVAVLLNNEELARATENGKKLAEKSAAAKALKIIKVTKNPKNKGK